MSEVPNIPNVTILRPIGEGATAIVYRGHDDFLDIPVAVKCVRTGASARVQNSVLREVRKLVQLRHQNLISVYRAGVVDGYVYVVMDYVGRMTLETLVTRQGVPPRADAVRLMAKVLDVLSFLHAQRPPVIHMDVSPVNIMIDRANGEPRLMDFGSAVSSAEIKPYCEGFASLERKANRPPSPAMDVYAAGAVLWYLLSGSPPPCVPEPDAMATMPFGDLLGRMLAADPAQRPTAAEAARLLRAGDGQESPGGGVRKYVILGCLGMSLLGLIAAAGIGLLMWFLGRGPTSTGRYDSSAVVPTPVVDSTLAPDIQFGAQKVGLAYGPLLRLRCATGMTLRVNGAAVVTAKMDDSYWYYQVPTNMNLMWGTTVQVELGRAGEVVWETSTNLPTLALALGLDGNRPGIADMVRQWNAFTNQYMTFMTPGLAAQRDDWVKQDNWVARVIRPVARIGVWPPPQRLPWQNK
jgi:tRNA A-37 threonylcarbamoyl transferase component Bud32